MEDHHPTIMPGWGLQAMSAKLRGQISLLDVARTTSSHAESSHALIET